MIELSCFYFFIKKYMDQVFKPATIAGMNFLATTTAITLYTAIDTAAANTTSTFPTDPTAIDLKPEDGDIRLSFFSDLTPTATQGRLVKQGETISLRNRPLKNIKIISAGSSSVKCSYDIGVARPEEEDSFSSGGGTGDAASPISNPTTSEVTVTSTATQLLSASASRQAVILVNGSIAITLGPSTITAGTVQTLAANQPLALDNYGGELWAITASGSSTVRVFTY